MFCLLAGTRTWRYYAGRQGISLGVRVVQDTDNGRRTKATEEAGCRG
jgi:hypothetical protein